MTGIGWLILAVVVLVAGYLGWSSWRERSHQRQVGRMFPRDHEVDFMSQENSLEVASPETVQPLSQTLGDPTDAAFADRLEPVSDAPVAEFEARSLEAEARPEAVAMPLFASTAHQPSELAMPQESPIEAVASLYFDKPGRVSISHLVDRLQSVGCGLRILGLDEHGELDKPVANRLYQRIDVYLLLASRRGPVVDACIDRFCDELDVLASGHALRLSCPGRDEIAARARDLDAFCGEVDVLASLSVVAPEGYPFRGSAIHRLASDVGLKWSATGAYVMQDDAGATLFSLTNSEGQPFLPAGADMVTHGFILSLEAPLVADGLSVFSHMTAIARMLADRLSGQVVDAEGRLLAPNRLQADHDRLQYVYERMAARGIAAGSDAALRVFA